MLLKCDDLPWYMNNQEEKEGNSIFLLLGHAEVFMWLQNISWSYGSQAKYFQTNYAQKHFCFLLLKTIFL